MQEWVARKLFAVYTGLDVVLNELKATLISQLKSVYCNCKFSVYVSGYGVR